jgi:hypothetical protein
MPGGRQLHTLIQHTSTFHVGPGVLRITDEL